MQASFYQYVETPNANLICCICSNPFVEPTTIQSCYHTFCRDCIEESLGHLKQCPVDRSPISEGDLLPANPIVRSLVDELPVECLYRSTGCTHTCQRQHLSTHLQETCLYSEVPCPEGKCERYFPRKDASVHTHNPDIRTSDNEEFTKSDNKLLHDGDASSMATPRCHFCFLEISDETASDHQRTCPERVPCPHASFGCPYTGSRATLDNEHLPVCIYEAFEGFLKLNNARMMKLVEENMMLRSRVQSMESAMKVVKTELGGVKGTLGPWYRPTPTQHPSLAGPSTSSRPSQLNDYAGPDLVGGQTSDADLAPYFAEYSLPTGQPRPTHRISSSLGGQLHEHPGLLPRISTHVAPLNLSTSLEGSLVGLRESVVTLASSLDSMGRRNEIAVANEVMRLNEEIMSLRANMHGLRMQIHAIMMDRNAQVTGRVEGADLNWLGMQVAPPVRLPGNPPSITKL
ncbi:hypothetical protein BDN72DRAFT_813814 [Pluteus cervinus]|uniref:Uncharacterized protein n=1 Tax=Pluteus cervinus TaxID=181527 RepID=A0ACD3B724_9AGAR|nr:hypothetical protein BDN72DRAFT_813814 [Pluteus cervinus]